MAMSPNFFNKREPVGAPPRPGTSSSSVSGYGQPAPVNAPSPAAPVAVAPSSPLPAAPGPEAGSKLTVGPNIKLKGVEITDCDTLVVEGMVEATMDSRVMQIAEHGAFKGAAEIDIAEIRGHFDGTLMVRQKLTIFATGKVSGQVSYGKLVIEEGGQLSGDIRFGALQSPPARRADAPALVMAA